VTVSSIRHIRCSLVASRRLKAVVSPRIRRELVSNSSARTSNRRRLLMIAGPIESSPGPPLYSADRVFVL